MYIVQICPGHCPCPCPGHCIPRCNLAAALLGGNSGYLQGGMTLNASLIDGATHKLSIPRCNVAPAIESDIEAI